MDKMRGDHISYGGQIKQAKKTKLFSSDLSKYQCEFVLEADFIMPRQKQATHVMERYFIDLKGVRSPQMRIKWEDHWLWERRIKTDLYTKQPMNPVSDFSKMAKRNTASIFERLLGRKDPASMPVWPWAQ